MCHPRLKKALDKHDKMKEAKLQTAAKLKDTSAKLKESTSKLKEKDKMLKEKEKELKEVNQSQKHIPNHPWADRQRRIICSRIFATLPGTRIPPGPPNHRPTIA